MVKVNIFDSPNRNVLREPSKFHLLSSCVIVLSGLLFGHMSGWFVAMGDGQTGRVTSSTGSTTMSFPAHQLTLCWEITGDYCSAVMQWGLFCGLMDVGLVLVHNSLCSGGARRQNTVLFGSCVSLFETGSGVKRETFRPHSF